MLFSNLSHTHTHTVDMNVLVQLSLTYRFKINPCMHLYICAAQQKISWQRTTNLLSTLHIQHWILLY